MNKEQHDKLIKYESIFKTAIESNYYRSMDSRFASDFIDTCHELNVYIKPSCVLNALKTMGKLYFEYKEPVEENPIQDVKITEAIETITKQNKVSKKSQKQSKKKK